MSSTKCCICGQYFTGFGNDPWPVTEEGICCDICNADIVLPARMAQMHNRYVSPGLPRCVTGASKSGVCGNRECIERHGIGCCIACPEREDCNVTCGWLEEPADPEAPEVVSA